jgi:hypothetical protein
VDDIGKRIRQVFFGRSFSVTAAAGTEAHNRQPLRTKKNHMFIFKMLVILDGKSIRADRVFMIKGKSTLIN